MLKGCLSCMCTISWTWYKWGCRLQLSNPIAVSIAWYHSGGIATSPWDASPRQVILAPIILSRFPNCSLPFNRKFYTLTIKADATSPLQCDWYLNSNLLLNVKWMILSPVRMYFFRQPFLMIGDPDMIKEILIKEFPKFHDRRVRLYSSTFFII